MNAEEELIRELAKNGSDKQRDLFLKFQEERNKKTEDLLRSMIALIIRLAINNVRDVGIAETSSIIDDANRLIPPQGGGK